MPDLVKTRAPRARKPQWCSACQAYTIAPGDTYRRDTYVYGGHIYDWPVCVPCGTIVWHVFCWWSTPEEGVDGDAFTEWALEHRDHAEHGEAAQAYLARAVTEEV